MSRIRATYRIETPDEPEHAAEAIANEQSSGTFVEISTETDGLAERHGATVESITELEVVDEPSLPGSAPPAGAAESPTYTRAEVDLSYPVGNIGTSLQNLMTLIAGNLFVLKELSGVRLVDLSLPEEFAAAQPGPQFGIEGTRELLGVHDRPIIGSIIKPSVGLSPEETGDVVETLVEAGVDFIKDDELIASPPYSRVEDRIAEVMDPIHRHEAETGKTVMYACNVTGDVDEMLERHDAVKEAGGNCLMVSLRSVGLAGVQKLREESDLPIHGHRNGWGALSRCPQLGFSYEAWQKLWRLAGVDHLHVSGIRNKFTESDESVVSSAIECQTPIASDDDTVMPVFSSAQWAGQAHDTYESVGNTDLMYLAGGGIHGHPDGPRAGVAHLKQGWEAAMKGVPLDEYAETHDELRTAIEYYGDHD
ncbi:ribulose-bisphosphate carboxylase large subunit family protein (plasmid) [Haloterrigena salifodinae]|uniref:Ribulose-bisphosphate carboxylase large subunit family protein n=1 Tax=Haloterrigena salifodinae TaxID=2675099 RepID=A0A8T8E7R1_9EURY|nr:ribulose-bisphosphate carboxylase large subunit family protein [Haloterrigena salifodinae]QRV17663.1 ribulose-bisphosphate carboxylase large subunit family protein [Haloterrigena salifodinae]